MADTFYEQKNRSLQELARFYAVCEKHKDNIRKQKIERLAYKLESEELIVAFCGHFSAGKSAMINTLMDENILPSSPIPTSANLIAIHVGAKKNIRVTLTDDRVIELMPPLDESIVGQLGKNGIDIKRIDLYRSQSQVPKGVTVLDTPGIDSVDDAHKQSTESAIHLADLIFYVMDYNHVQSQMNFEYIRNLIQHNRPVHAIINQIDKHRDEELPFSVFKESTEQAFSAWNATPASFHYTSLKKSDHPYNEIEQIQHYVNELMENQKETILMTTKASLEMLKQEHENYLQEELEDMLDTYSDLLTEHELSDPAKVFKEEETLERGNRAHSTEQWIQSFDKSRDQLIKSAYLMPAEVRDKAKSFLEASQSSFKAGLFFSSKKTKEVKNKRTEEFVLSLNAIVDQQLVWHMKNICYEKLKEAGISSGKWTDEIEKCSIQVTNEFVNAHIKSGAEVSGQSVLNYCEDVSASLRSKAKLQLEAMKKKMIEELENEIEENTLRLQHIRTTVQTKANALRSIAKIESQLNQLLETHEVDEKPIIEKWQIGWNHRENDIKKVHQLEEIDRTSFVEVTDQSPPDKPSSQQVSALNEDEVIRNLESGVTELAGVNGFSIQRKHLLNRLKKIKNKDFTIALFGAFSAGKSSFANALLQKKVLPVSPNPTTASINRIKPPSSQNPDGTVRVFFKQSDHLMQDLKIILDEFGLQPGSMEEANSMVQEALESSISGREMKKSFLRAFQQGWPEYKNRLGEELVVKQEEFEGYVANEHQSCFVESIDYYLTSTLADEGVTIVDTPGADSINSRHTDVSFDYIRSADAILFVTYYNHAFARADREFLIQLGRIKESFEMDKMFFVVNAVDLAESKQEKNQVLGYMEDQLISFGIRFPRIFGVSSLQAISDQQADVERSGIVNFKKSFNEFLQNDLYGMTLQAANAEFSQTLKRLENQIRAAKQSNEEKQTKIKLITSAKNQLMTNLSNPEWNTVNSQIQQELKELLLYMEQRVFYRFSDFFKESFHPSLFIEQSNAKALEEAIKSLLEMIGFDFSQEFRVINHRISQMIQKKIIDHLTIEWESYNEVLAAGAKPPVEFEEFQLLIFNPWFKEMTSEYFKKELALFKNARSFFEKNEKRVMKEAIEVKLRSEVKELMLDEQKRLSEWIELQLSTVGKEMYTKWTDEIIEQLDSQLSGMQSDEVLKEWEQAYQSIVKRSVE